MSQVAKVIELIGSSPSNWEDAVESAIAEASNTIRHISGVEVTNMTADIQNGQIVAWRATVKIAFGIESESQTREYAQREVQTT